jgi:hypothetical protein
MGLIILLNIHRILLTFIDAMQNGQNLRQILLQPSSKFGAKDQKIF